MPAGISGAGRGGCKNARVESLKLAAASAEAAGGGEASRVGDGIKATRFCEASCAGAGGGATGHSGGDRIAFGAADWGSGAGTGVEAAGVGLLARSCAGRFTWAEGNAAARASLSSGKCSGRGNAVA